MFNAEIEGLANLILVRDAESRLPDAKIDGELFRDLAVRIAKFALRDEKDTSISKMFYSERGEDEEAFWQNDYEPKGVFMLPWGDELADLKASCDKGVFDGIS